jgi:aryl-alcohol dehydrogenase-like predicted oxidoreductase
MNGKKVRGLRSGSIGPVKNKEKDMRYNKLPRTALTVSQLSLGTMMFGGQTGEPDSIAIMDYAFEQGVNFFDTANVYNQGESEKIVGKWLKNHRDRMILATKVRGQMGSDPNDVGLSRRNILSAVEASLRRLNTDYIDIYYMHSPDYATGIEESLQAMDSLVKAGKIRYVAVSNYAAWQIADMLRVCEKYAYVGPVITQNVYNLITRGLEAELGPFLTEHKIGMAIYNPIAGGFLAGKHRPGKPAENTRFANNKSYFDRYWSEENFRAVEKLTEIASGNGMSILELSMKWCAAQPAVTSIISGVSRLEQIKQNIAALEGELPGKEVLAACDEVWRGLAGTRFAYNR